MTAATVYAVVIAGGTSRRFGSDKLSTVLGTATILEHALSDIPAAWEILVVGPPRDTSRPVTFIREEPAGSGPGAALVAGAQAVVARGGTQMVCLPGDAPAGGRAAAALMAELTGGRTAVVAVDSSGRAQPLQVAVTGAALATLASHAPAAVAGSRARDLVEALTPYRLPLPEELMVDIDTTADADTWRRRQGTAPRSD